MPSRETFPAARGGPVVSDDYPPPPISPGPVSEASKVAFARWEVQSAKRRAYREKHGERLRANSRRRDARKRAERPRYCCLLKHTRPLAVQLPAVATDKPHQ